MKDIPGYKKRYAITRDGKVWSYPRRWIFGNGSLASHNGRFLKGCDDKQGYWAVSLTKKGKTKQFRVHRLVALTYIPNPRRLFAINHINAIRNDNRVENLEWCSLGDNVRHCASLGRMRYGEKNPAAKLKEKDIKEIRRLYASKRLTATEIARRFGISHQNVSSIGLRKTWRRLK